MVKDPLGDLRRAQIPSQGKGLEAWLKDRRAAAVLGYSSRAFWEVKGS